MKKTIALSTILMAGAALSQFIVPASAADVNVAENPFNGAYFGVNGGYGWADSDIDYKGSYETSISVSPGPSGDFKGNTSVSSSGGLLGAQFGANYVMDNGLLIGAEVNGNWSSLSGDSHFTDGDVSASVSSDITGLGIGEVKLGWANSAFAIYGLGGVAIGNAQISGNLRANIINEDGINVGKLSDDQMVTGWTLGVGADYMVGHNVSLGVAYNYIGFGDFDSTFNVDRTAYTIVNIDGRVKTSTSLDVQVVRATLNYHF
jgi:outer membrane immunogenic protein